MNQSLLDQLKMTARSSRLFALVLIAADVIILLLAFALAYIIRVQLDPRPLLHSIYARDYALAFLTILPFWLIIFSTLGLYKSRIYTRRLTEWGRLALGSFLGILLVIGYEFVSDKPFFPARLVAVYALIGSLVLLITEREILRFIRTTMFRFGRGIARVLIIGNSAATSDIARQLSFTAKSGFVVAALAGPKRLVPNDLRLKHYSTVEQALKNLNHDQINAIIQTDLYDSADRNQKILGAAQINHISYNFIPGEAEFYSGKNEVDVFLGYPVITVHQTPLTGWGELAKRIFDFIVSLILIILLSPIFIILVLLQMIFNPGPAFYISKRLSKFSEPVNLIKFRTMRPEFGSRDAAEEFLDMNRPDLAEEYRQNHKVNNDPRITKFGKFLRVTSLDEFPGIFNVIKGDLSLVGPRPILPQEMKFSRSRAALLHSVKSGVTGLWQVSGRNDLSFDERIDLELFYAQNWSFWLDIKILFKTVAVVFLRRGAK